MRIPLEVTDKFIPKRYPSKNRHKIWINKTVIQAVKLKHLAWNKYNKSTSTCIDTWDTNYNARNFATFHVEKSKE